MVKASLNKVLMIKKTYLKKFSIIVKTCLKKFSMMMKTSLKQFLIMTKKSFKFAVAALHGQYVHFRTENQYAYTVSYILIEYCACTMQKQPLPIM